MYFKITIVYLCIILVFNFQIQIIILSLPEVQ